MQETVESGAGHDRVTGKDVSPFGKGLLGSDDGCGVFLVTVADDLEEHAAPARSEVVNLCGAPHKLTNVELSKM